MIEECAKNRTYCFEKQATKPLIKLKVDYTNFRRVSRFST